jgi:L-ribulose-5-phosphate 3-epimerase UlaE
MRKVGDGWHDQRLIELIAVLALTIIVLAGVRIYFEQPTTATQAAFIVPSQTVRW